jgi:hypothetical protein
MAPSRRTLSLFAATFSGALVLAMAGTALAADDLDCSDFDYQEEAEAVLDADGVVCDWLPRRGSGDNSVESDGDAGAPVTTPAAAPDEDDSEEGADGDRHCTDVATQARAQAALTASPRLVRVT